MYKYINIWDTGFLFSLLPSLHFLLLQSSLRYVHTLKQKHELHKLFALDREILSTQRQTSQTPVTTPSKCWDTKIRVS